jgi:transcriptional regulator with XRE-family HTH domain
MDTTNPIHMGQYLRSLRRKARLRTADIAEMIDVSSAFISMAERGKRGISTSILQRWVKYLNGDLEIAKQYPNPRKDDKGVK